MAIKFNGNALFTLVHQTVIDLMEDLDPEDIADFCTSSRLHPYSEFVACYGSLYEGCSDDMINNELGWHYMRLGFNKIGNYQEGLTPPSYGERDDVVTLWLNRLIMDALTYYVKAPRVEVLTEYLKSVPVLVAAALTATLSNRDLAVTRHDLVKGGKFYDYSSSEWNNLSALKNYDLDVLEQLLISSTGSGAAAKQRIFYVQVTKWMSLMFNKTHPLADQGIKFTSALRQQAVRTVGFVLQSESKSLSCVGKEDELETVSPDLAVGSDYTDFKNGLLAEIVAEWNCATWYAPYTSDVLIHNALSNDMIEGDLFAYRHRILAMNGDEALYSQY